MSRLPSSLRRKLADEAPALALTDSVARSSNPAADLPQARRLLARQPSVDASVNPPGALADLEALPDHGSRVRLLLNSLDSYLHPAVLGILLDRSETTPSADASAAESFAKLSLLTASLLPEGHSALRREGLFRGHLAQTNALRLQMRFGEAAFSLDQTRRLLPPSPPPRLAVPFRLRSASLAIHQMDAARALHHLECAEHLVDEDDPLAARLYALRAWILGASGDISAAAALLRRAVTSGKPVPYDDFVSRNMLINSLLHLGRHAEAADLFGRSQHAYDPGLHPNTSVHHLLVRARLAFGEQDYASATHLFHLLYDVTQDRNDPFFGAIASLFIAQTLAHDGQLRDATRTFRRAYPILSTLALLPLPQRLLLSFKTALTGDHDPIVPSPALAHLLACLFSTPLIPAQEN